MPVYVIICLTPCLLLNIDCIDLLICLMSVVRSMGPVDEMNEVYSLDCYFRQTWMDKRLR